MAYEMVMPYHLHMPSYFLETFTEYPYVCIPPHIRMCEGTRTYGFYFTSSTTIDLAGRVTFKLPLLTFAPVNSFGATTFGFSKLL